MGCGFVFVGGIVGGTVTLLDAKLHPGSSDEAVRAAPTELFFCA
jgi:hypothetical protein